MSFVLSQQFEMIKLMGHPLLNIKYLNNDSPTKGIRRNEDLAASIWDTNWRTWVWGKYEWGGGGGRGKKQDREELLFICHFGSSVGVLSTSFLYNSWHLGHELHISLAKKVCSGFSVTLQGKTQMNFLANVIYCQGWWKNKEKKEDGDGDLWSRGSEVIDSQDFDSLELFPPLHQVSFTQVGEGGGGHG